MTLTFSIGWPDAVEGLYALKKHAIIATLSNGNVRLLVDMVCRQPGLFYPPLIPLGKTRRPALGCCIFIRTIWPI